MEEKKLSGEMPVMDIIEKILESEFQDSKILSEERKEYLTMSIFSKILCFALWLEKGVQRKPEDRASMRKLIAEGICREVI